MSSSPSTTHGPQRSRRSLFFLRLLFWLGVVYLLLQFVISHRYVHQLLQRSINKALKEELGVSLLVGKVQLQVFPPRLELLNVELVAEEGKVLTVNHLAAELSVASMLLGRFQLASLTFNHVLFHHYFTSEVLPHLKEYFSSSQQPPSDSDSLLEEMDSASYVFSWDRLVKTVRLYHGGFERVGFRYGSWAMDMMNFDLSMHLEGVDEGRGRLEVLGVRVQDEVFSYLEGARLALEVAWKEGALSEVKSFELYDQHLSFKAQSTALKSSSETQRWSVESEVHGDLSLLGAFIDSSDQLGQVKGDVGGELRFGEDDVDFALTADIEVQAGSLDGFQLYDSTILLDILPDELQFRRIFIKDEGVVYGEAQGFLSLAGDMAMDFSITPQDLSVSDILEIVRVSAESVDGQIRGPEPIRLYGFGEPFKLHIQGRHVFENFRLSALSPTAELTSLTYPHCLIDYDWFVDVRSMNFVRSTGGCFSGKRSWDLAFTQDPADHLSFSGVLGFEEDLDLGIELRSRDLSVYKKLFNLNLEGEASGVKAQLGGSYQKTLLDIHGSFLSLWLLDLPLGKTQGSLELDFYDQRITFKDIEAVMEEAWQIPGDPGKWFVTSGYYDYGVDELSLALSADHISSHLFKKVMSRFIKAPSFPLAQFSYIDLDLWVPLSRVDDLKLRGRVEGRQLRWSDEKILESFKGELSLAEGAARLATGFEVDMTGAWPWQVQGTWKLASGRSSLADLMRPDASLDLSWSSKPTSEDINPGEIPVLGTTLQSLDLAGPWRIKGELSGPLSYLDGQVYLSAPQATFMGRPFPFWLEAQMERGEARYHLKSRREQLWLKGVASLSQGSFQLSAATKRWNVMPYLKALGGARLDSARNYAYLSSVAVLGGPFKDPGAWQGSLELGEFHSFVFLGPSLEATVEEQGFDVTLRRPSRISLESGSLSLDRSLVFFGDGAEWVMDLKQGSTLEQGGASLEGRYDFSMISGMVRAISSFTGEGSLLGELSWGPSWDYSLRAFSSKEAPARLLVKGISPPLKDITYDLSLSDKGWQVHKLSGRQGSGRVNVQGVIPWSHGDSSAGLDIDIDHVMVQLDAGVLGPVVLHLDGDLELLGSAVPFTLGGHIKVLRALSARPLRLVEDILNNQNVRVRGSWSQGSAATLLLDVDVDAPSTIFIKNNPLDLVMAADLNLSGNVESPEISGYLEIPQGKVFYKREYEIMEGSVVFDQSTTWNPLLDVKARTEIDDYRINVALRGRSQSPRLDFFADPALRDTGEPLSRFEILFLMLNGSLPEKNVSWDQQQDILISESVNLAFRVVNQELSEIIELSEESLVENISLGSYSSPRTGDTQVRVEAPLNVGEEGFDVTLHGGPESLGVRAEYELDPNVATSVSYEKYSEGEPREGGLSSDEEASVGLRFRFSFP